MKTKKIAFFGDFLIRVVAGIILIVAGWGKLTNMAGFEGYLTSLGFFAPGLFAWIGALVEFIGGILLLLGLWTHIAASIIAIQMFIIIIVAHWFDWSAMRLPLLLLAVSIRYIGTAGFCNVLELNKSCLKPK